MSDLMEEITQEKQGLQKITMRDAQKLQRETGCSIMHIYWFDPERTGYQGTNIYGEHLDCSHVLVSPIMRWRHPLAVEALILGDRDADEEGSDLW